jgi:hypothetical protein
MTSETITCSRDRHLFGPGPKKILSVDGGGVRGAIAVAFLERMESLLKQTKGVDATLGSWFDLIGGTSTGAIIAGALALNHTTSQVKDFYDSRSQLIFRHSVSRIPGLRSRFDAHTLSTEIERVVGDRTLDSEDLVTGFALVTKRMDTGAPWILANNPRAKYWDAGPNDSYVANKGYRLSTLVRASTAAPYYFDPEIISIQEGQPNGLFIDGGVSPHNNPSLVLFMMATMKAFGICWPASPDALTIVSVGTGSYRRSVSPSDLRLFMPVTLAVEALSSLVSDAQTEVLALMQWLGRSLTPWVINSEIGDLRDETPPGPKLFNFVRYDVLLEPAWLEAHCTLRISESDLKNLREIDRSDYVPLAYEIGRQAADAQVRPEHFGLD